MPRFVFCKSHRVNSIALFNVLIIALLGIPILIVIASSFTASRYLTFPPIGFSLCWYRTFFENPQWLASLFYTTQVAVVAGFIAVLVGFSAAYGMTAVPRAIRPSLITVFFLPLMLPAVVIGTMHSIFFAHFHLQHTWLALGLSQSIQASSLSCGVFLVALRKPTRSYEDAACALGAPRWYAVLSITLRSRLAFVFLAFALSFALSFDESVISLFLGDPYRRTLPRLVFEGLRFELSPVSAVVAAFSCVIWGIIGGAAATLLMPKRTAGTRRPPDNSE